MYDDFEVSETILNCNSVLATMTIAVTWETDILSPEKQILARKAQIHLVTQSKFK